MGETPRYCRKRDRKNMTDKELIEDLREEIVRVRTQRNKYELELREAKIEIANLKRDNKHYESYINRTKNQ